jgi:hypothetical protein
MAKKAYEVTLFKPNPGMDDELMGQLLEMKQIFLTRGVSSVDILNGIAGKYGYVMVIQTFDSLTHNASINEDFFEDEAWNAWWQAHKHVFAGELLSHDLYQNAE